jgi:MoaA/NifB/PqqE/SkfB family radical SAM enzyme
LARLPPFAVEITLNAVTEDLYERISGCPGSFRKVMAAIGLLQVAHVHLRLKTQVTRENTGEVARIRAFARSRGLPWESSSLLYPRLDGDLGPAASRVDPRQALGQGPECAAAPNRPGETAAELFPCVLKSGQGIYIDPYGFGFLCRLLRRPRYELLRTSVERARSASLACFARARFKSDSRCRSCGLKEWCPWCPGFAYLETGSREKPIAYCCQIARGLARAQAAKTVGR